MVTALCQNSVGVFLLSHSISLPASSGAGQPGWLADKKLFIEKPPTIAAHLKEHIPLRLMNFTGREDEEEEGNHRPVLSSGKPLSRN